MSDVEKEAAALLKDVTPGEWVAEIDGDRCNGIHPEHGHPSDVDCWSDEVEDCPARTEIVTTDSGYYGPRANDARFIAASPRLVRGLLAALASSRQEVERLTKREAECHDVISALWAITDPEGTDKTLMARVHAVLGADDPEGQCGNALCAEVERLTREHATLQQQVAQVVQEMGDHLADNRGEIRRGEVALFEGWLDTLSSSLPDQDR